MLWRGGKENLLSDSGSELRPRVRGREKMGARNNKWKEKEKEGKLLNGVIFVL